MPLSAGCGRHRQHPDLELARSCRLGEGRTWHGERDRAHQLAVRLGDEHRRVPDPAGTVGEVGLKLLTADAVEVADLAVGENDSAPTAPASASTAVRMVAVTGRRRGSGARQPRPR